MADRGRRYEDLTLLAALQRSLRVLEDPTADVSGIDPDLTPGVRRRLTARALDDAIRSARAREAALGLQRIERRARDLAALALTHPVRIRRPVPRAAPPGDLEHLTVFWSPTPVLGFRMWSVRARLAGAKRVWTDPTYTAGCLDFGEVDDPDVPHTDGRCRRPPCGLYAAKEIDALVQEFGLPRGDHHRAYGLVELSGKVVEHERGYRARRATAVAVAVVGRDELLRFEGRHHIAGLFASPRRAVAEMREVRPFVERFTGPMPMLERLVTYLEGARLLHEAIGGGSRAERSD